MQQYSEGSKTTFLSLLTNVTVFLVLGGLSLWFAISVTVSLIYDIEMNIDVIIFYKVGFYFYGIGIGLLVIPLTTIYAKFFKFKLTNKGERYLNGLLALSVVLMLVIPHATHYYVGTYLENNEYIVCKGKSKRSLYITTIEYSKEGKCDV